MKANAERSLHYASGTQSLVCASYSVCTAIRTRLRATPTGKTAAGTQSIKLANPLARATTSGTRTVDGTTQTAQHNGTASGTRSRISASRNVSPTPSTTALGTACDAESGHLDICPTRPHNHPCTVLILADTATSEHTGLKTRAIRTRTACGNTTTSSARNLAVARRLTRGTL